MFSIIMDFKLRLNIVSLFRSGRIRKKSSKLADFQSPDEGGLTPTKSGSGRKSNSSRRDLSGSIFDDPSEQDVSL